MVLELEKVVKVVSLASIINSECLTTVGLRSRHRGTMGNPLESNGLRAVTDRSYRVGRGKRKHVNVP